MSTTINRRTDYAARVILDLAMRPAGAWTTTREVAERRLIPSPLVRQIIRQLVRAGLLRSQRGAEGGITLARPSSEISLLDVLEVMEGPLLLNLCVANPQECPLVDECPVHQVWVDTQQMLEKQLRQQTFDRLARRALAIEEGLAEEGQ